ncbi:putative holin-like toxin [Pedobacter sp. WC2423]|uniref:putative holin-like toxin n=1 Tax=Pedobacter sp. WC2423 TaxID=3234142 RepID=UPI003466608E
MINLTEAISVLIGFGGFVTAFITSVTNKKKSDAEVQNVVADTYGDIIVMLREQGKINAEQITTLMKKDADNMQMLRENQQLINQYRVSEKELMERVKELESEIDKLKSYNESTSKIIT